MPLRLVLKEGETRIVKLHGEPVRVRCRKVGRCKIEVVMDDGREVFDSRLDDEKTPGVEDCR